MVTSGPMLMSKQVLSWLCPSPVVGELALSLVGHHTEESWPRPLPGQYGRAESGGVREGELALMESLPYPLSAAILGRVGPTSCLGSTIELGLVAGVWVN